MRIHTALATTLAALVSLSSAARAADKDEHEEKIKADQIPAAAKATLDQQTAGAKVKKYEKETRDGKVVYIAEVKGKEKGQEIEYVVSEDGKLLATEVDEKGKDKDEKEEKEEKGEHDHHDK
jgi:hypothetical protein